MLLLACLTGLSSLLFSQSFDPDFKPFVTRPAEMQNLAVLPDGRFIAAGNFTFANRVQQANLARFLANGALDVSFQLDLAEFSITAMVVQPDGKVLIGGRYTADDAPEGITIIRLNTSGSLDNTFQAGFAPDGNFSALALEGNGNILVGGAFTNFDGQAAQGVVRLSSTGALLEVIPLTAPGPVFVSSLLLQANGRFVVGGTFNEEAYLSYHENSGAPVAGFNFSLTLPGTTNILTGIRKITQDNLGRIVFSTGTFLIRYAVVILNTDGSYAAWNYVYGIPMDIVIDNSNTIYVAGDFGNISGLHAFDPVIGLTPYSAGSGADGLVRQAVRHPNGGFLIAGDFSVFNGETALSLERLAANGLPVAGFNPTLERAGLVRSILRSGADKLYIGGDFAMIGTVHSPSVGRILLSDGSPDPGFINPGISYRNIANALVLDAQGRLLVAGTNQDNADEIHEAPLLRLLPNGAFDPSFQPDPATFPVGRLREVIPAPNGRILTAGDFNVFNPNIVASKIALYNANGTLNDAFSARIQASSVWELITQADGRILIGGTNIRYDGATPSNIIRLYPNLARDLTFQAPAELTCDGACRFTFTEQPDGRILAGGSFLMAGTNHETPFGMIRLMNDGTLDPSFNMPASFSPAEPYVDGEARSLQLFPDGRILAVGLFDSLGTTPARGIYVLAPDGTPEDNMSMLSFPRQLVLDAKIMNNESFLIGGFLFDDNSPDRSALARVGLSPVASPYISGTIATNFGSPMPYVELSITGQPTVNVLTETNGQYYWDGPLAGNDYTITPMMDFNHGNGVTTADLILINRHILGVERILDPYRLIAADVNRSQSISNLDLIAIQRIVIGITETFGNNTSYRFVDAAYSFPQPANPWAAPFPETITLNDLPVDGVDDADFIAIKIGDLNGDAVAPLQAASPRSAFHLLTSDSELQAGATIAVPIFAEEGQGLEGCQFTLRFNTSALELEGIDYGLAGESCFGWRFLDQGWITTSWYRQPGQEADSETPLFTLHFRARQTGVLSRYLSIGSDFTPVEGYDEEARPNGLSLEFEGMEKTDGLVLFQNTPNPFYGETVIGFELPESGEASLRVYTVDGRLVYAFRGYFDQGYNEFQLGSSELPEGTLFYTLQAAGQVVSRRMVVGR